VELKATNKIRDTAAVSIRRARTLSLRQSFSSDANNKLNTFASAIFAQNFTVPLPSG
jgi:hypothetical protein